MPTFTWVSGRLTEVHRFVNVPMRWCEQYPARERREVWLSTSDYQDIKLVVHTRSMPARCGHEVVCVLHEGQLVGLRNLSTADQVNFIRSDPPLLWRRCDGVRVAALFVIAFFSWCVASLPMIATILAMGALLHGPCTLCARWLERGLMKRATDQALASAVRQATARPPLWRVK